MADAIEIVVREVVWTIPAWIATVAVSFAVIRLLLGVPVSTILTEIEDHQNTALGVTFFGSALLVSFMVGKAVGEPVTEGSLAESLAWMAFAFTMATIYFLLAAFVALLACARRRQEGVRAYLRREIVVEQNSAIAFFALGIATIPFVVATWVTV